MTAAAVTAPQMPTEDRGQHAPTEMDVGPFFFTQPNPPITHLREMQTPVL